MAAFYLPATPASQLSHNGIDPAAVQPVLDLIAAGDISAAARTLPPEVAAAQCGAGTPQQCATQIADTFQPAGFNHLGFGLVDGRIVKTLTGTDRRGERGPPEARRPSRSSSPPGYWASTRLTASRSSTLRPEPPRPEEAKCQVIVAPLPGTQVIPGGDGTLMFRSLTALQACPCGLLADLAWVI
jgi:hypothetical protein